MHVAERGRVPGNELRGRRSIASCRLTGMRAAADNGDIDFYIEGGYGNDSESRHYRHGIHGTHALVGLSAVARRGSGGVCGHRSRQAGGPQRRRRQPGRHGLSVRRQVVPARLRLRIRADRGSGHRPGRHLRADLRPQGSVRGRGEGQEARAVREADGGQAGRHQGHGGRRQEGQDAR